MLTYLVRPRGLYREPEQAVLQFPGDVELEFQLEPGGPFGEDVPPLRTAPLGANVRLVWNACRGETTIQTDARLPRLNFLLQLADGEIEMNGSVLTVRTRVQSRMDLQRLMETYFYALPPLLGLDMLDSCIFTEVRGRTGDVSFCWGLLDSGPVPFDSTTREIQEERIKRALSRLRVLDERQGLASRRLLAAVQYFHIACRLARTSGHRWEFLAESLLNLAKILEALFPAAPERTIDTARQGLFSLGFDATAIEALYIPALALRNAVDVAHPTLAAYSNSQLAVLQRYTCLAEDAFRQLLVRVFESLESNAFTLAPPPDTKPSAEALKVIARIDANLARYEEEVRNRREQSTK